MLLVVAPSPDVINDWLLNPWDHEMGALAHHLLLHTHKPDHVSFNSKQREKTHIDYLSKMTAL